MEHGRTRFWMPERAIAAPTLPAVTFEGLMRCELLDAHGGSCGEWRFPNVLTNGFMDAVGGGTVVQDCFDWLEAGTGTVTGTGTPSASNASLVSPITAGGRTNANGGFGDVLAFGSSSVGGPFYWSLTRTRLFDETQANGNITELGFWDTQTGGTLMNRVAVKDASGSVTTISKTSTNQLRVTYEFRAYLPSGDSTGSLTLGGSAYSYTIRPLDIDGNGWSKFITQFGDWVGIQCAAFETQPLVDPTGSLPGGTNADTVTALTYAGGAYRRDVQVVFGTATGNFSTGVQMIALDTAPSGISNRFMWQIFWNPKIPKTALKTLTLVFRQAWNRTRTKDA